MKIKLILNSRRQVFQEDSTSESECEDEMMSVKSDTQFSQNPFDPDDSDLDMDQFKLEVESEKDEDDDDDAMSQIQSPAKAKFISSSAFKPPSDARQKDLPKLKKVFIESTWSVQCSQYLHDEF